MIVNVLFFGHYSDYFPAGQLTVTLPDNATVRDLAQSLAARDARLSTLPPIAASPLMQSMPPWSSLCATKAMLPSFRR